MSNGLDTIDRLGCRDKMPKPRLLPPPEEVTFTAYGVARPAGSKTARTYRNKFGNVVLRSDGSPLVGVMDACTKSGPWKKAVRQAAKAAFHSEPFTGPVEVLIRFVMPRPKGHFGSGKNAGSVKALAPPYPISKPDLLKLARLVEDVLTGIVYADDSATVSLVLAKVYGSPPRCEITVRPIE